MVDENMDHFREVLEAALSADYVPEDAVQWAKSALKAVNPGSAACNEAG